MCREPDAAWTHANCSLTPIRTCRRPPPWPAICERFLEGLDTLAAVVAELEPDGAIQPPIECPLLASYTARDAWEHVAQHNAHHLGQIVVLRQVLGIWPPPAGSYTW